MQTTLYLASGDRPTAAPAFRYRAIQSTQAQQGKPRDDQDTANQQPVSARQPCSDTR